jgi:Methyl-accepting chemotaxis protein (MCP) signalling domain
VDASQTRTTANDDALGPMGRLVNRMLPERVQQDPEEARRGRLLVPAMTFLMLAAFFFSWEAYKSQDAIEGAPLILLIGGIACIFNWPLLWITRSVRAPGLVVSLQVVFVIFACGWYGRGVNDSSQTFLQLAPVVASFIIGPAAGFRIAALAIASTLLLHYAPSFGHEFTDPVSPDAWFDTAGTIGVLIILSSITYMYEEARRTNLALVQATMFALRDKNIEMQAINEEIAQRRDLAEEASRKKDAFLTDMGAFSTTQAQALDRTRQAISQLADTIRAIAVSAETLASAASSSDTRLNTVSSSATAVQQTVEELLSGVDDTSAALTQLTDAVHEMQRQFTALSRSAESTTAAMGAMEESATRVEQGATRTAALASAVIEDAQRGSEAMRRAQMGVDEIRASSKDVDVAIRALGARVAAISRMNAVIEEVAVETNVLALNASIIAAQAGSNGLGFSVVADQIKALAARTAQSTREISAVIAAVEGESENASAAIERGNAAVNAGTALSTDAQKALEQIVASASASTQQVKDIELATVEQARRARAVGEAMGAVARQLATAGGAVDEHKRASAQIENAMDRLRRLAPALDAQSRGQVDASSDARRMLARVSEMASELSSVQGAQTRASDQAVRAVEEIQRAQKGASQALAKLDR